MAKRAAKPVAVDPLATARGEFLKQGTDPAIAKKALEDATGVSRALWLSFLTFGTYLVITFAGVDHRDLLLETPIVLPVLNAPLPLVTFFWVAPILFVIFHLYLLLSLKLLADQVHSYVGHMEEVGLDTDAQDRARLQLPNFVVVQVLGGTSEQIKSWAGRLMRFTAFLTLVAGPIILLLFAQLMFLPYHGWGVTMGQRVMVTVDLVMIWYFWGVIRRWSRPRSDRTAYAAASLVVLVLTFFGFMYPGERLYGPISRVIFVETNWEDHLKINEGENWDSGLFYNTLELAGQRFFDDELVKKLEARNREKKLEPWLGERSIETLSGRDFQNANFRNIDLRKADLSEANFNGANFGFASLQGASFNNASLQHAALIGASLQGASLERVSGQFVSIDISVANGASLRDAKLQGASFIGAQFDGASLDDTSLQGSTFFGTSLRGASFNRANLQGSWLLRASLEGATLDGASLEGVDFGELETYQGMSLRGAYVWRNRALPDSPIWDVFGLATLPNPPGLNGGHYGVMRRRYDLLVKKALEGVATDKISDIKDRLVNLDPSTQEPTEVVDWLSVERRMSSKSDFARQMIEKLTEIVCDSRGAPYVAQSIVGARLAGERRHIPTEALSLVEKLLSGCPGTNNIDENTVAQLRETMTRLHVNILVNP